MALNKTKNKQENKSSSVQKIRRPDAIHKYLLLQYDCGTGTKKEA